MTTSSSSVFGSPSPRAVAGLAGLMLAVGVAVGAAIGPAPDASFAGASRLPQLLPSLTALALARAGAQASTAAVSPPTTSLLAPAPSAARHRRVRASARKSAAPAPSRAVVSPTSAATPNTTEPSASAPVSSGGGHTTALPAVTSVSLIELSGGTFTEALAQPAATPYIDGQLIPASTFLSGWSALTGSAFASDAALAEHRSAVGSSPPILASIVEPPCPEGAAGAKCAPGTAGALSTADEFLKATVAQITAGAAYRQHGLIVVTFATVGVASAAGLPSGASTATLTSVPPAGVVLMSPFARAGARPSTAFNPTSPQQSLAALLH